MHTKLNNGTKSPNTICVWNAQPHSPVSRTSKVIFSCRFIHFSWEHVASIDCFENVNKLTRQLIRCSVKYKWTDSGDFQVAFLLVAKIVCVCVFALKLQDVAIRFIKDPSNGKQEWAHPLIETHTQRKPITHLKQFCCWQLSPIDIDWVSNILLYFCLYLIQSLSQFLQCENAFYDDAHYSHQPWHR